MNGWKFGLLIIELVGIGIKVVFVWLIIIIVLLKLRVFEEIINVISWGLYSFKSISFIEGGFNHKHNRNYYYIYIRN